MTLLTAFAAITVFASPTRAALRCAGKLARGCCCSAVANQ